MAIINIIIGLSVEKIFLVYELLSAQMNEITTAHKDFYQIGLVLLPALELYVDV